MQKGKFCPSCINISITRNIYKSFDGMSLSIEGDSCCLYFQVNQIFIKVNPDSKIKVKRVIVVAVYTNTSS